MRSGTVKSNVRPDNITLSPYFLKEGDMLCVFNMDECHDPDVVVNRREDVDARQVRMDRLENKQQGLSNHKSGGTENGSTANSEKDKTSNRGKPSRAAEVNLTIGTFSYSDGSDSDT